MIFDAPETMSHYEFRLYHSALSGRALFNRKDLSLFLKKAKLLDFDFQELVLVNNQKTGKGVLTTLQKLRDEGI